MPRIENPISEPVYFPDWGQFKVAMFATPSYQRISGACPEKLIISRIESFFVAEGTEFSIAVQLWGAMLQLCPDNLKPTAAEVAQWNQIAASTEMPLKFTDTGQLTVKET